MVKFIGEYTVKLDDKGRLVFPAAFKALMPSDKPMRFVVKKNMFANCLDMFTYEEWDRQSEEVKSKINFFTDKGQQFWRKYTEGRVLVEPDAKVGRITISKKLLDAIGVTKEVLFVGSDHKIEIWAGESSVSGGMSDEEFAAEAALLFGN